MASIYDNIRVVMETTLSNIVGIPDIAWENLTFTPTTTESFVKPRLIPTIRRPAVQGSNPQMYYQGIYRVDCFVPEGLGPAAADDLADLVIEAFEAATDLSVSGTIVSIRYAEREQGIVDNGHFVIPVNIGWYIYN